MKHLANLVTSTFFSTLLFFAFGQSGSLDPTFGSGGIVTTFYPIDNDGEGIAVQSDGKIVLTGTTFDGTSHNLRVVRYLDDGSLDNTFGTAGTIVLPGLDSYGTSITIQPDDKILVAGYTVNVNDVDVLVARLNADGTLDNTFGVGGIIISDFLNINGWCNGIALQSDGKILVVGGRSSSYPLSDVLAARYHSDGNVDSTFGMNGIVSIIDTTNTQWAEFVVIQDDGKIVMGGTGFGGVSGKYMLIRVNSDGTLDNTFGTNGIVTTSVSSGFQRAKDGVIQDDGKILIHGHAGVQNGTSVENYFCTVRYNTNGTLDQSFGSNGGIVTTPVGSDASAIGTSIALRSDGRIIVAGDAAENGASQFAMVRYLSDGNLDPMFGAGGIVLTPIGVADYLCNAMTLQSDESILLAGESDSGTGNNYFVVARYDNTVGLINLYLDQMELNVFPNPITSESVIQFSLLDQEDVTIQLFDLNGKLVQTVMETETQAAGVHQINLDGIDDLSSGSYILKVETESSVGSIEILK